MVANYLGAVGIKVQMRTMERAAFLAAYNGKQLRGYAYYGGTRNHIAEVILTREN